MIWENPRLSSTLWCRPIRMLYNKETMKFTRKQVREVQSKIMGLQLFVKERLTCHYKMYLTVLNDKIICALTKVGAQNCHICWASWARHFRVNELNRSELADPMRMIYGLTTTHGLMKCMDLILKLSYRGVLEKYTIKGSSNTQRKQIKLHQCYVHRNRWKKCWVYILIKLFKEEKLQILETLPEFFWGIMRLSPK